MWLIAFFETRFGGYVLLFLTLATVIGAVALDMKLSTDKIAELRLQVDKLSQDTDSLRATNAAILRDMFYVAQAQGIANAQIDAVRQQAAKSAQAVRQQPAQTPAQVDQQWQDTFSRLEKLSHAP